MWGQETVKKLVLHHSWIGTGGPFKPGFGLSGQFRVGQSLAAALSWFRVVYSDSVPPLPDSQLLVLDQPSTSPP